VWAEQGRDGNETLPTPAKDLWEARFGTGWKGQDRYRPATWVLDDLWSAAGWETRALEVLREHGNREYAHECLQRAINILEGKATG